MRGSLWIENEKATARVVTADEVRALLATCVVGALAGVVAGYLRLGLGLPGHKALMWMAPVIAARWAWRSPVGATGGTLAAGFATFLSGGHFAGAALHLPVAAAAGTVLDLAIGCVHRRQLAAVWAIPLVGAAGMAANLAMLGKRLLAPLLASHVVLGTSGLPGRVLSYALFGLAAGLVGATVGWAVRRRRHRIARTG